MEDLLRPYGAVGGGGAGVSGSGEAAESVLGALPEGPAPPSSDPATPRLHRGRSSPGEREKDLGLDGRWGELP